MKITESEHREILQATNEADKLLKLNKILRRSKSYVRLKWRNDRQKKPRKQKRYLKYYSHIMLTPIQELTLNACKTLTIGLVGKSFAMGQQIEGVLNQLKELRKEQENQNK